MTSTRLQSNYKNWNITIDDNDVIWLSFDLQNKSANILNSEALGELDTIINNILDTNDQYSGLIIESKKSSGFIFGADILNFIHYSKEQIEHLLILGQSIYYNLEKINNTVCVIDGLCLGGGLELALACDYRVISIDSKLGLPEVSLGILPGWGGTVRLPRLVGSFHALTMMITGKPISSKKCKLIGLADAVVHKRQLQNAALWFINNKVAMSKPPLLDRVFSIGVVRRLYANFVLKKLRQKVNEKHYPSPYAIVKNWTKISSKQQKLYNNERRAFVRLIEDNQVARNLIRVYELQQLLKKHAKTQTTIKHVHVVGAGVMGSEIAIWCALKGFRVTFSDNDIRTLSNLMKKAMAIFKFRLRKGYKLQAAFDRLIPDYDSYGIKKADLIIEAVSENLKIKTSVWKEIDAKASKKAVLATNTSSLPLEKISKVLTEPDRLIGVHFFNPVSKMPLVEVIYDNNESRKEYIEALNFVKALGKLPLPVKSYPGFLVNRILMPYILEAFIMVENENISKEAIDQSMLQFGMPMGPIELADVVGLDVCMSVGEKLQNIINIGTIPSSLERLVKDGKLGKKTGEGFYKYKRGKKIASNTTVSDNQQQKISERLVGKMYEEAEKCLQENIVASADLIDAAMIFGTGYAPFRGGLLKEIK
jgi:3-hydroxyacyl-CoA dehydrogenase/enoyl-CoA hydratase/3-hydroxybutyryl-CoA epimerase